LKGLAGAGVATLAIFAPSFLFVALTAPLLDRLRRLDWARRFLQGANAAAVGVMAAVLVRLFWGLPGLAPKLLALGSMGILFAVPAIGPVRLVLGAAALGALMHGLGIW
jgi:chromate transporter